MKRLSESELIELENSIPSLARLAALEAMQRALSQGISVVAVRQGRIYRFFPDGTKEFIKYAPRRTRARIGRVIELKP